MPGPRKSRGYLSIQSTPVIPTPVSQHWRGNPLPGIIADGYRQEALRGVFPSLLSLDSAVSVFIVQPRLFKKAPQIHALNQRSSPFRALRSGFPLTGGRMLFCCGVGLYQTSAWPSVVIMTPSRLPFSSSTAAVSCCRMHGVK